MTDNLKPCPFCGGEDKWQSIDVGILPDHIDPFQFTRGERYVTVTLTCKHCGATIQGYSATVGETIDDLQRRIDVAVNDAHVAWNTRAERMCKVVRDKYGRAACSECSFVFTWNHPVYCESCGAKVVDA